ncbi:hypothetical protein HUN08_12730 [Gordonia sp. X0973]|uniref:hypothetical protein n=1 Tax=Gordonia sp. X0973 TaxID=2742602 RepID=UPI000F5480C2|nr:hypothetical protein [Gordonia sp. X0973]QKT07954.1 hypothetical protein HUN08_12730 [Gordonia sp. X0973]
MLVSAHPRRRLGVPVEQARLHFGSPGADSYRRCLFLSDAPAFDLSLWCTSCPFLFERQPGANEKPGGDREPLTRLEGALHGVDDAVLETFAPLLPAGDYLPLLLEVTPELVAPHDDRDYFTHEQVQTWGVDRFWGLPENPRSFYYRTFETAVDDEAHLYEFVVPMVPPAWNDRDRVRHYEELIDGGATPTAVALSTLDICMPATTGEDTDCYAHWGLTHFLLDGHHKLEAAARTGGRVRLLALVTVGDSLATSDEMDRLPSVRDRVRAVRGASGEASR